MSKLLQVAGFPSETTAIQLVEFLRKIFPHETLQNVWFDPYREPRAVVMFLHELGETKLHQLVYQEDIVFHDHILAFKFAKPTWNIFVRTYGSIEYGAVDKVRIFFQKNRSRKVEHVRQLDDDCYEITFSDGWDAVLEVCKKDWPIGQTKLTVCPYFECFQESTDEINERISIGGETEHRTPNISIQPSAPVNFKKPAIKLFENIVPEASSNISEASKNPDPRMSSDNYEKTMVFFKHQCIPILLSCLHFDHALAEYDCQLKINVDQDNGEFEFEITGPKTTVKKIARLLDQEYKKVKSCKTRNDFLAMKKILSDLKKVFENTKSVVVLTARGNDFCLDVFSDVSSKVTFQDFVSFLVIEERFSSLSSNQYQELSLLVEKINNEYKYGHIFVSGTNVTVMFLSHKRNKMEVVVELFKSKFKSSFSVNEEKVQENNFIEGECNTKEPKNVKEPPDSENARKGNDMSEMTSMSEEEITKEYCFKHSFLFWLLQVFNLRSALAEIYSTLTLEFNKVVLKVMITGQPKQVEALRQCLQEEDEMISLTEYEETFLQREQIKSQLLPLIKRHEISFVSDSKDSTQTKLAVKICQGKLEQFQEFIKSLLITKTCLPLPNQEVYESQAWQTFQKSFNSQYDFCEIFVTYDLMVTLLALAHRSKEIETVIHIIEKTASQHDYSGDKALATYPAVSQGENDDKKFQGDVQNKGCTKNAQVQINKDKKKASTLTLICQSKFFVWLLNELNFHEVVEIKFPGTSVRMDVEEGEVVIKGDKAESTKSLVLELDGQISYTEDEETFFLDPKILQHIETTMKRETMNLVLGDSLDCFVQYKDDNIMLFKELPSYLCVKREFLQLPSMRFQTMPQWIALVESVHSNHPFHKVVVEGPKVMILTLKDVDETETIEIQACLNEFIFYNEKQYLRKNVPSALEKDSLYEQEQHQTALYQNTEDSQQNNDYWKSQNQAAGPGLTYFLQFNQQQIQYCNMFLQQELYQLQEQFKSSEMTIESHGINLKANSEHCLNEMKARMKSLLHKIITVTKNIRFPGLVSLFNSKVGLKLISDTSLKYQCFIEPPMDEDNKGNTGLEVLQPEDKGINYKVTLIGTAIGQGFKVHLVQGNIRDMKSDVKVEFRMSPEVKECESKTNKSSCDIIIFLPRWKAPENSNYHQHFNELRESLRKVIAVVFEQVKYLNKSTVTFGTDAIHDEEFPFPLDVIAKIFTEELCEMLSDSSNLSMKVDVYICEPKRDSVFKAFSHYMKRVGIILGSPDQTSWDQICQREIFQYPDYRQYKHDVEIVSCCPEYLATRNLICYPIQPSLEASSCPVYADPKSSKHLLEKSFKELQKNLADGLLVGDTHYLSSFPVSFLSPGTDVLIYCIPQWGSGVYQALKASLKNIFKESHKYDAIIITPPGLGFQNFPLPYLVQIFFPILDQIIRKGNLNSPKKIFLIVENTEYKKVFESELQKRFPKNAEKQHSWWPSSITSFWHSDKKKEHKGTGKGGSSATDPSILVNNVSSLPIKYSGTSQENIDMAHSTIEKELKRLMNDYKCVCKLDKTETCHFEKISDQIGDMSVSVTFEKHFSAEKQGQKVQTNNNSGRKKKKNNKNPSKENKASKMKVIGSEVTIKGLSQRVVNDFRDMIMSAIGKDKLQRRSSNLSVENDCNWPSPDEENFKTYVSDSTDFSVEPDTSQNSWSLTDDAFCHDASNKTSNLKELNTKGSNHCDETAVSKNQTDRIPGASEGSHKKESLTSNDKMCQKKVSASPPGCSGSFKWLYEASEKTNTGIFFKNFYEAIDQMIEVAYSIDKKVKTELKDRKVKHVDFSDMTVTLCNKEKGIIRVEELDFAEHETKPASWTVTKEEVWKFVDLDENKQEFQSIESELKEKIPSPKKITKLKFSIKKIQRIENINLYQRFKTKKSLLDGDCIFMWHKVSQENVPLVCQFGFHPRFSSMRDESMGDGVLFKGNPWNCLEEEEIKDKKTVYLIKSRLILGQTGPGSKRFRGVHQDTKSRPQDSVQVDDQAMIFSDAQAYPSHLITFIID